MLLVLKREQIYRAKVDYSKQIPNLHGPGNWRKKFWYQVLKIKRSGQTVSISPEMNSEMLFKCATQGCPMKLLMPGS